jgi:hypothetical protein
MLKKVYMLENMAKTYLKWLTCKSTSNTKKKKNTRRWCYAYVSEIDSAHNEATKQFVW